jgi:hypothetical protein
MGWESRGSSSRYYYRSIRRDGVPRKVYVGAGAAAEACARRDAASRRQQVAGREALLAEQTRIAFANHALSELGPSPPCS